MKLSKDNWLLTAYALGELGAGEAGEVERAILADESLRTEVEAIRGLAGELEGELLAEPMPRLPALARARLERRAAELDRAERARAVPSRRPLRWAAVAAAAVLLAAGAVGMWALLRPGTPGAPPIVNNGMEQTPAPPGPGPRLVPTPSPYDPYLAATPSDFYEPSQPSVGSAAVTSAARQRSTFGLNVADASYKYVRQLILEEGRFPEPSYVRIEEMINHFRYDYALPQGGPGPAEGDGPLAVRADLAQCPWSAGHVLLRVAIQARGGTAQAGAKGAEIVAGDAWVGVSFDPAAVAGWRLIGYDGPMCEEAAHGEQIAADWQVTALYELVPAGKAGESGGAALAAACTVRLEYKLPDGGRVRQVAVSPVGPAGRFEDASDDFRFAATVAGFGMILRNSPYKGTCTFEGMLKQAQSAMGDDRLGQRSEFAQVLREATGLPPAE
jgi:anti-sigma-K factor RskA